MKEPDRLARNKQLILELIPTHQARFWAVFADLEGAAMRIRAQEAYRTPFRQKELFNQGLSKAAKNGKHTRRLALDVVDDDHPLSPNAEFIARLAVAAWKNDLITGCLWGLPVKMVGARMEAIVKKDVATATLLLSDKCGWDPCHIEVP